MHKLLGNSPDPYAHLFKCITIINPTLPSQVQGGDRTRIRISLHVPKVNPSSEAKPSAIAIWGTQIKPLTFKSLTFFYKDILLAIKLKDGTFEHQQKASPDTSKKKGERVKIARRSRMEGVFGAINRSPTLKTFPFLMVHLSGDRNIWSGSPC